MKYGAIPTNMLERLALWSGKLPVPMLDALFGPIKTRAIMAGVSLGVFDALRAGSRSPAVLAEQLRLDESALELLMRTLVVCEYLEQNGGEFSLSPLAWNTMVNGAPMELVGFMKFNYRQWEFIEHLEELVRTGRGVDFHKTMTDPDDWKNYQRGMFESARFDAPTVAARVPVPRGATRLLDLAGSHGLFGATICRRHPPMRSTVLDLPRAIEHARHIAEQEALTDVVTHRAGDLLTAEYGQHDVVLMANILHHFTVGVNAEILSKVHSSLSEGGTAAIWEIEAPVRGSKVTAGDGAALYFRLTSTAGAYHGDEYATWLRDAGFHDVKIVRPVTSPGSVLVIGRRQT